MELKASKKPVFSQIEQVRIVAWMASLIHIVTNQNIDKSRQNSEICLQKLLAGHDLTPVGGLIADTISGLDLCHRSLMLFQRSTIIRLACSALISNS